MTAPPTHSIAPASAPVKRNSTTGPTLRRIRLVLLALTAVVLALSSAAVAAVQQTAAAAAQRTVPALMAISAAAQALAEADSAAVSSFAAEVVPITGPSRSYQTQISLAGQSLEQLAETRGAGTAESAQLLLIDSQVTDYRRLIEQAHADYAAGAECAAQPDCAAHANELGLVEVIYASRLMHETVLPELIGNATVTGLRDFEERTLADQSSRFWMSPWTVPLWLLPAVALLVVLVRAQRYLSHRFRRTINWSLLGATVLLTGLAAAAAAFSLHTESRLRSAKSNVEELVSFRTPKFDQSDRTGPVAIRLNSQCRTDGTACGKVTMAAPDEQQVAKAAAATGDAAAAATSYDLEFIVPAAGGLVGVLVLLGLQPRIRTYRSRSR